MNGWLEEEDDVNENVNNEDIEDEDVEIEVDDDVELIFSYEVEGDQTPPPRDESSDSEPPNAESSNSVSSDSVSSDSESEDEEVDVCHLRLTVGLQPKTHYAIRDFSRAYMRFGDDLHDIELTEAEVSTNQTEIALLKLKNKIVEKEKEILNHDLENVERALGNVLERVSAVPKPQSDDEDTERPRKESKNSTSDGTEGPFEPRGPPIDSLLECIALDGDSNGSDTANYLVLEPVVMNPVVFEPVMMSRVMEPVVLEPVNLCSNHDCKERDKVTFATASSSKSSLSWWNGRIASMGICLQFPPWD
ncbi:hypothetical protein Tco_1326470 [Tanacetum coccineum]